MERKTGFNLPQSGIDPIIIPPSPLSYDPSSTTTSQKSGKITRPERGSKPIEKSYKYTM